MPDRDREKTTIDYGFDRTGPAEIEKVRILGRGRAANAVLVDLHTSGNSSKVVEKHFVPAGLTQGIYKGFFGAPFPYGINQDAALACLYRRHVAGSLLEAETGFRVAKALYVRRCEGGHWVLGTEWIQGRPVAPPKPREGPEGGSQPGEMRALLQQMKTMERCLLRSGLIGSGWQVATAALVSTANLLRTPEGKFVCVDLESGIPAVLAPRYLGLSLLGAPFPMFDDLDEERLRNYLDSQRDRLRGKLGAEGFIILEASAERLIHHSRLWKRTELAPGRHRTKLLFDKDLRNTVRSSIADRWKEDGRLDDAAAQRFRSSRLLFLHPLILGGAAVAGVAAAISVAIAVLSGISVGTTSCASFGKVLGIALGVVVGGLVGLTLLRMFPSRLGKLFQRLIGNRAFRARFFRALIHPSIFDAEFRAYQVRRTELFLREKRVPPSDIDRLRHGLWSLFPFAVHDCAAQILPARWHHYLADWHELGLAVKFAFLALFSERIQEQLAYSFVENSTRRWKGLGRLDENGSKTLIHEIQGGEAPEYARGFGMHLALKFFEPLTGGLKIVGGAFITQSPWSPLGYILVFNTSVFRMMITTYRWLKRQDRSTSYAVAFAISWIPIFGTLAFPFQFYHRRPWLGRFLIRSSMSRLAGAVPIYGGTGTRVEHGMVRFSTPLTAFVAGIIWPLKWLDRGAASTQVHAPSGKGEWCAAAIDRAIEWLSRPVESPDLCEKRD